MKLKKRLLAVVLSGVLLCPATAYAAQPQSAQTLYDQVQEKSESITDMNAFYDFNIRLGGSVLKELRMDDIDMRLEMNVKMNHIKDPDQLRYMAYCRLTDPWDDQMTFSMHYLDGYMYMDMMGEKMKTPLPVSSMMEQSRAATSAFDIPADIITNLKMWDEDENRVVGFTIDENKMNEFIQQILSSAGMSDMTDGTNMTMSNMKGEYVVNPDGDLVKVRMNMDLSIEVEGETLTMSMDGDVGIADPGQPVEVPVPNIAEYEESN